MKVLPLTMAGALLMALMVQATETTTDTSADFTRYQVLIDRSPFGQVQGPAGELAPNWLANYVLTGIIQSNSGNGVVQAIISTKDNTHWYFRAEGETVDAGVTVLKIDQTQRQTKVMLKNGLETGTLTFAERAAVPAAAQPSMAPPQIPGAQPGAVPPGVRRIPFRRSN